MMMKMKILFFCLLLSISSLEAFTPSSLSVTRKDKLQPSTLLFTKINNKSDTPIVADDEKSNSKSSSTNVQEEQLKDINLLIKQKEQRETAINRLKFQLNELRLTANEREDQRAEAEKTVEKLTKDAEKMRSENQSQYDELVTKFR